MILLFNSIDVIGNTHLFAVLTIQAAWVDYSSDTDMELSTEEDRLRRKLHLDQRLVNVLEKINSNSTIRVSYNKIY